MKVSLILLFSALMLVSCGRDFPAASQKFYNAANQDYPPSGKSNIYLFSTDLGSRFPLTASLNGKSWGQVSKYHYLFATVEPSRYNISAEGNVKPIAFQTLANQNYFFDVKKGLFSISVEAIKESKGRKYMKKSPPSGINVFDK
jgi:hypothetical protein